jgi:integrase
MEFRYHHLRHTFCTILSDNNCNLKYISEAAGHSNEKFTFDRYIHTTEKMRDESVAIIDKVFGFDFPHTEKSQ